jgi:hypothetical protein
MAPQAYEAWWLPTHVIYRFVAVRASGRKTWHASLEIARQESKKEEDRVL